MQQPFVLEDMLSALGSTFYPTNHIMIMLPDGADKKPLITLAETVLKRNYYILTPQDIITKIGASVSDNDTPLPSVGTEGAHARMYIELAQKGYSGLLMEIKRDEEKDEIIYALQNIQGFKAWHYRRLVIEELTPKEHNDPGAHLSHEMQS